jgi:hypothetical protein
MDFRIGNNPIEALANQMLIGSRGQGSWKPSAVVPFEYELSVAPFDG